MLFFIDFTSFSFSIESLLPIFCEIINLFMIILHYFKFDIFPQYLTTNNTPRICSCFIYAQTVPIYTDIQLFKF